MNIPKPIFFSLLSVMSLTISSTSLAANNAENGKQLYEAGCNACHNTSIHTRPDRIIFSKAALIKRIKFCDSMAGNDWNDQQLNDVADYLNQSFYKFDD